MQLLKKIFPPLIIFWLAFCIGYYFKDDLSLATHRLEQKINPCDRPILYSLGAFDARFNLNQSELREVLVQAENIWETPLQKNLFDFSDTGALKVNLVYDARQDSTLKLQKLGLQINNDNGTYDTLKSKYDSLTATYNTAQKELTTLAQNYEAQKSTYEQKVKEANKHGGAAPEEYVALEAERLNLNNLTTTLNQKQDTLSQLVDDINAVANVINRLVKELNLNVNSYNTIGGETSGEFQAGEYVSDSTGERINVYQFDNHDELISLLAHELGHAFGLEHVDDPQALMYHLEQNGNATATAADLAAARSVCRIK